MRWLWKQTLKLVDNSMRCSINSRFSATNREKKGLQNYMSCKTCITWMIVIKIFEFLFNVIFETMVTGVHSWSKSSHTRDEEITEWWVLVALIIQNIRVKGKKRLMTINDTLETVVNNAVVKHHVSMSSIFLTVSTLGHVMNSIYFFCYLDDEQLK